MSSMAVATRFHFHHDHRPPLNLQVRVKMVGNSFLSIGGRTRNMPSLDLQKCLCKRLSISHNRDARLLHWNLSATGSGLEASVTDSKKSDMTLENAKIVVESRDDDKIHVRVDLTGEETQKAFDEILTNLARTAPPMAGFRRTKGGKTSNVPKSFLLQMLGRDRVTKFLIQEVVSTTIGDFVKKENLTVKNQFKTTQTEEELESAFVPGNEFGFNATVEIEKTEPENSSPDS